MTLFCCSISSSPEASIETARPSLAVFWDDCQYVVHGAKRTVMVAYLSVVHLTGKSHADGGCDDLLEKAADLALRIDLCAEDGS